MIRPQLWQRRCGRGYELAAISSRPSITVAAHPCHRRENSPTLAARLLTAAALIAACVGLVALRALL